MNIDKIISLLKSNSSEDVKIAHHLILADELLFWNYCQNNLVEWPGRMLDSHVVQEAWRLDCGNSGYIKVVTKGTHVILFSFSNFLIGKYESRSYTKTTKE